MVVPFVGEQGADEVAALLVVTGPGVERHDGDAVDRVPVQRLGDGRRFGVGRRSEKRVVGSVCFNGVIPLWRRMSSAPPSPAGFSISRPIFY